MREASEEDLARKAEAYGFSHVWTFDSHLLWEEPFVIYSQILAETRKVVVGPMVTNPATRDWTVTASTYATLNEMFGNRTVCGIGRGDSAVRVTNGAPTNLATLRDSMATLAPTGGQERGYRPGTENLPGVLGYAAALAEPEPDHGALRAKLDDAIRRSGGEVVAEGALRHPAIGSYRLRGSAAAAQLILLDSAGFAVSAGSACSSGSMKPSHVLAAMGWSAEAGREVIRVSFGRTTTEAEVDAFIAAWRAMAKQMRRAP